MRYECYRCGTEVTADVEHAIAAAVEEEREACARLADVSENTWRKRGYGEEAEVAAHEACRLAAAIRARSAPVVQAGSKGHD